MTALYEFEAHMQAQIDHVTELLEQGFNPNSDEVQLALQAIVAAEGDLSNKAEKVGLYIRSLIAEADMAQAEADRLLKIKKSKMNRAESMKYYLLRHLTVVGVMEVKSPICPIKLSLNNWSVQVENAEALPPEYQRKHTTIEADKKALLANRESLGDLQGVKFDRSMSIRIG